MTIARIVEQRSTRLPETRSGLQTSYPSGAGWVDPSAIPPPGLTGLQRAGVYVSPHSLLQVDVVFTALRVLSNNVIKMGDLRAYREQFSPDSVPYRVWLPEQPALLTDTWGGIVMQCTGMDRTIWSMALFGEAFWYVLERDALGYASALDVLNPAYMDVEADKRTGALIYLYGPANNRRTLDPDDVTHIPFKSLPQSRRALSPIVYAGVAGALAMAAYEFGSSWFSQGASPDFILSTDRKLGQAEIDRIAQKFVIEHSGLSAAHLPLVIDNGLKADKVMVSPDESQYLNTLEYSRSVIFSWFGCEFLNTNALQRVTPPPPGSMQEESMRFLQHTLSGYLVPVEEATSRLLPDGIKAAWDETKLMRPDSTSLAQLVTALRQGQLGTPNDLRTRYLGWPPVEGGDDIVTPLASNTSPSQTANAGEDQKQTQSQRELDRRFEERDARLIALLGRSQEESQMQIVFPGITQMEPAHVHVAAPAVTVNVDPTPVNVDVSVPPAEVRVNPAPVTVNVEPTPVTVTPAAPEIHVEPTPVTVEAPDVTVRPEVTVLRETPAKRRQRVVRNRQGRIVGVEDVEPGEDIK